MRRFTVRELRRDAAQTVSELMAENEIVEIVDQGFVIGFIVSVANPAVSKLKTDEPTYSLSRLYTRVGKDDTDRVVVPMRLLNNQPIPLRFGTSPAVAAWMVPLSWGPRLGI